MSEMQGAAPVVDRRPVPRGVLPPGIQTWLMVALALGIVLIVFLTGQPEAPARTAAAAAVQQPVSPDRVRDYQERLKALNEQMTPQLRPAVAAAPSLPPSYREDTVVAAPRVDPIDGERKRREYESLFASNVVVTRRQALQNPSQSRIRASATEPAGLVADTQPSLDDIADAVVRASARSAAPSPIAAAEKEPAKAPNENVSAVRPNMSAAPAAGLHRVLEGTVIDAILTNRLDGGSASPVNCLVTNAVYSPDRRILIPAGARILGSTRMTEGLGDTRLAVGFHRLVLPDGQSFDLNQFKGLNQLGDNGLRDRVNQHYWSTFGSAAAIGLVGGLSQLLGYAALSGGDGDRTVVVAGGSADSASQAAAQSLGRFLNRMPTITIREGHRVKVYVTSDIELPEWTPISTTANEQR